MTDEEYQVVSGEGDKASREYGWKVGFGLQQTDGLTPSRYALGVAQEHIDGRISYAQASQQLREYHQNNPGQEPHREADLVAQRISEMLQTRTFALSPGALQGIHKRLFEGVFNAAWVGVWRSVNITKSDPVLNGASVSYSDYGNIEATLDYDFAQERRQIDAYADMGDKATADGVFSFISGIWQIHPFREGNTRTCAVFAIQYLRFLSFDIDKRPFEQHATYLRNALALASASSRQLRTMQPLRAFETATLFDPSISLPELRTHKDVPEPDAQSTTDVFGIGYESGEINGPSESGWAK